MARFPSSLQGSLPIPRTRLTGREAEMTSAGSLLLDSAVPLLTLTGPGVMRCGQPQLRRSLCNVRNLSIPTSTSLLNTLEPWPSSVEGWTGYPGTIIPPHQVSGSELVYVERGALETDFGMCGNRCIQTIDGIGAFENDRCLCHADHGISAGDGATIAYHVAGSTAASLLIVSVMPAGR